jgi:cellulose biosynthesis protein BcsQ
MDFSELFKSFSSIATIVGAIISVLGFFFWLHKRAAHKHDEETKQLKADRDALKTQSLLLKAELEPALFRVARYREAYESLLGKARTLNEHYKRLYAERNQLKTDLSSTRSGEDLLQKQLLEQFEVANTLRETLETNESILIEKNRELRARRKEIKDILNLRGQVWLTGVPKTVPAFRPLKNRRTTIIAVLNLKGGVGKTTITANLGGFLGLAKKRVLMIDLDHQRSLSRMLMTDAERQSLLQANKSVQAFLESETRDGPTLLSSAVKVAGMDNCELIANHDPAGSDTEIGLDDLEMQLLLSWKLDQNKEEDIRFLLRNGLHSDAVTADYDYVLLDCPPRLTTACVNALAAADFVMIPVQPEAVASRSVLHLMPRLNDLRTARITPELRVLGIVGNMVRAQKEIEVSPEVGMLKQIAEAARTHWPETVAPFATVLTRMTQYFDASRELHQQEDLRLAVSFPTVRKQFESLVKEIEERIHERRRTESIHRPPV